MEEHIVVIALFGEFDKVVAVFWSGVGELDGHGAEFCFDFHEAALGSCYLNHLFDSSGFGTFFGGERNQVVARLCVAMYRIGFGGGGAVAEIPEPGINRLVGHAGEGDFCRSDYLARWYGECGKRFLGAQRENKD